MNVNSLSKCFISLNEIWCQKKGNLVKKKKKIWLATQIKQSSNKAHYLHTYTLLRNSSFSIHSCLPLNILSETLSQTQSV